MSQPFADEGDSAIDRGTDATGAAGADELKDLLNTIVDQLSDADRRHGDTLGKMQDRLAGIGRETQSLRERFPDQFAAAFDRIETGTAEMSARIVDAESARAFDDAPTSVADVVVPPPLPPMATDTPAVLRSAVEASGAGTVRSSEVRLPAGVDTFDVIESSGSCSVEDSWDSEAADALTSLYESGEALFGAAPKRPVTDFSQSRSPAASTMVEATDAPWPNQVWLEARFNEIAAKVEQSLAEVRPDHGFFALGQRFDELETNLGRFIDDVSRDTDADRLSDIRTHIGDVAKYLEDAHQQLTRLDAIEEQLGSISTRLDDVHRIAMLSAEVTDDEPQQVDVAAIVRATAEETVQRFTDMKPRQDGGDLRPMLERMMAEGHQNGENTAALLGTIQQAMNRLLDRIDALEMAKHGISQPLRPALPAVSQSLPGRFEPPPLEAARASALPSPVSAIDAELEDLLEPVAGEFQPLGRAVPARGRTDLIAEARRARMRLESEAMAADAAKKDGAAGDLPRDAGRRPQPSAPNATAEHVVRDETKKVVPAEAKKAVASAARDAGPSAPSMPLVVVAVVVLAALTGLWITSGPKGGAPRLNAEQPSRAAPLHEDALPELPSEVPANSAPHGGLELKDGTRGEIVPDNLKVGSTQMPMLGVAVDTSKPLTAEELHRSRRRQAMAGISSQLGDAAAVATRDLITPAALIPESSDAAEAHRDAARRGGLAVATPLDLPPATVGPLSLRLAAANGDPSAEFEVGSRMAEGKGTPQSFSDAAKWYQKAASRNFVPAQYRLGTLYERGLGVNADIGRAQAWYKRAAEQGNVKSMHNLAVLSANQSKESPDYATAAHWFREAADRGLADSQFNLAVLYENGLGVEKDLKQAFKWLSLAARGGDSDAVRRRDVLRGKLTSAEMAEAEVLIGTWKPTPSNPAVNDARAAGEAWKKSAG